MNKKEKNKHLQYTQRCQIEALLEVNVPKAEIAKLIGCSLSTLYYEIKRGMVSQIYDRYLNIKYVYSADAAQRHYTIQQSNKGASLKITDTDFFVFIENLILNKKFSPAAALNYAKRAGHTVCSLSTLYNYIRQGKFARIRLVHCPAHGSYRIKKKVKPLKYTKHIKRRSIEQRAITRAEIGHWEMDTVVGTKSTRSCLLVLTERKSRFEIICKLPSKTIAAVSDAIDALEIQCKGKFPKIFKTITCDNGSEFGDPKALEKSCRRKKRRTTVYYCHPFSSFERGTNEINNRLIRRFVPKGQGQVMEGLCEPGAKEIENWMNDYPRALLGGKTSREAIADYLRPNLFQLISRDSALPTY